MPISDVVKERRLRLIFELLDSANNKRVVQEVDRLLKKSPDFVCAKVLKALALLRMGKSNECLLIISPIVDDVPTDENTIQALSICYRELDQPRMVCQLLEKACAKDRSEDLLTHCFMAYARVNDYQKQHQTALMLYKLYPKMPYFSWAIMSLYVKAVRDTDPNSLRVSLPLAEKMMAKFIDDKKIDTEHELYLFMLILRKQGKYEKILEIIDSFLNQYSFSVSPYQKLYIDCLESTNKFDVLTDFYEEKIKKCPEEWYNFESYIKMLQETQSDRVKNFINELLTTVKPPTKSLLLSQFLLYNSFSPECEDAFKLFVQHFGGKPSFFFDLKTFLPTIVSENKKSALLQYVKDYMNFPINYAIISETLRTVNYQYLRQFFKLDDLSDPIGVLYYIQILVTTFLDARDQMIEANKEMVENVDTAYQPHEAFLFLAALTLAKSVWENNSVWVDYIGKMKAERIKCVEEEAKFGKLKEVKRILPEIMNGKPDIDDKSKEITNNDSDFKLENDNGPSLISNGLANVHLDHTRDYTFKENEFPVILSMAILEYVLTRSPSNSQVRILLSKLYFRTGAGFAAANSFSGLDLKHIQWESLGYMHLWKTAYLGTFSEATKNFQLADSFYSNYQKESMEHILSAYKYGSWEKVIEFMNFRDVLLNSLQMALIKVEKQLYEFTKRATNLPQYIQIAHTCDFDENYLKEDRTYSDSRDLTVHWTFSPEKIDTEFRTLTMNKDIQKLKIRGYLLNIFNNLVLSIDQKDDEKFNEKISNFQLNYEEIKKCTFDIIKIPQQLPLDGMWSNHFYKSLKEGHYAFLIKLVELIFTITKDPASKTIISICEDIEISLNELISNDLKLFANSQQFFGRDELFEDIFLCVETVGFSCLLLDIARTLIKKNLVKIDVKNSKKKKNKEVPIDPSFCTIFNKIVSILTEGIIKVDSMITSFDFLEKRKYPINWSNMEQFMKDTLDQDLYRCILPFSLHIVTRNLNQSYVKTVGEFSSILKSKISHLESICIPIH